MVLQTVVDIEKLRVHFRENRFALRNVETSFWRVRTPRHKRNWKRTFLPRGEERFFASVTLTSVTLTLPNGLVESLTRQARLRRQSPHQFMVRILEEAVY